MAEQTELIQGLRLIRAAVTIPANGSTAQTIYALSGDSGHNIIGCKIPGYCADGSERGALVVGDSTSSLPQYVAAGTDYYEPAYKDQQYSYIKAAGGSAITNACIILYSVTA